MKIDPSAISPLTNRVDSEATETKKETIKLTAGVKDSFVEAATDKAQLFAHPDAEKLNAGSGVVSGLHVSQGQNPSAAIHANQGTAVDRAGKLIDGSKHLSYFDGKKLDAADLQQEQQYKMDQRRLGGTHPGTGIDQGLLSSTSKIAAEFALFNPVMQRLCEFTGKSAQEINALLNQYGVNPAKLPSPPDQKITAFIQDPAFASFQPQDLLKALYGQ